MNRRELLSAGLAAGALWSTAAQAELMCGPFNNFGVRQCTAGLNIGPVPTAQQQCQNWCWAASIQTIFRLSGRKVSQERIVQKLFGSTACATATGPQIVDTITGDWETDDGQDFSAQAAPLLDLQFGVVNSAASAQVAQELAAGRPVINGALGHATVLTAMTYLVDIYSRGQPLEIIVRDPWPGNSNRRVLTAAEAAGTFFIAKVEVI